MAAAAPAAAEEEEDEEEALRSRDVRRAARAGCSGPSGTSTAWDVHANPTAPSSAHAATTRASGLGTTHRAAGIAPAASSARTVEHSSVSRTSAQGGGAGVDDDGGIAASASRNAWTSHAFTASLAVGPASAREGRRRYGAPMTFVAFVSPPMAREPARGDPRRAPRRAMT